MNDIATINTLAERPPGMGHNLPPLSEQIAEETAADKARTDELIAAAATARIETDEDAAKVTTLVALMRSHEKAIDARREERKRPFLENCHIVDGAYSALIRPLVVARAGENGRGGLTAALTEYQRRREEKARREREAAEAEQRRREAEAEAARRAAEEARAAGAGSVAAELEAIRKQEEADALARKAQTIRPEPIRSAVGAVSMRREIAFEITDLRKALGWLVKNRQAEVTQAARTILGKHLQSIGVDAIENGLVEIPGVAARVERRAQVR